MSLPGFCCVFFTSQTSRHGVSGSRYETDLTLGVNDGAKPGPTKLRPDFPRAVRTLAVTKHQEGRTNPYIPKHLRERQRPTEDKSAIGTSVAKLELERPQQLVTVLFLFFDKLVAATRMARATRTTRLAMTARIMARISTASQSRHST